jgi:selenide,water dikinase
MLGGEPQSALAIATVPFGLKRSVEADLSAMLLGANRCCARRIVRWWAVTPARARSLALGFAVNGLVRRAAALCKGGARPGDALILTKPLGTGTLLAAEMRGKTRARWLMGAFAHMLQSNQRAAEIVREHASHAATDVTGFGLLGHLVEMVRASEVDVTLALDRIPVLAGASETIEMGIFSSLQPQNVRLRRAIRNLEQAAAHPLFPLLFDPQTAGGLLVAVPIDCSHSCVDALRAAGYGDASIIAVVCEPSGDLEPVTLDLDGSILAPLLAPTGAQLGPDRFRSGEAACRAGPDPADGARSDCKLSGACRCARGSVVFAGFVAAGRDRASAGARWLRPDRSCRPDRKRKA